MCNVQGSVHGACTLWLVIFSYVQVREKGSIPLESSLFVLKTWHILPCFVRYLVEMAGVEPASASTTLENTTCLDIVYCFNTK